MEPKAWDVRRCYHRPSFIKGEPPKVGKRILATYRTLEAAQAHADQYECLPGEWVAINPVY